MKTVILVGCSGSGKSTYAKEWCKNNYGMEVNRDNFRKQILQYSGINLTNENMWKHWKFNKENEKKVSELVETAFQTYSQSKVNIVVSDTNLNIERRQQLIHKLQNMGYEVSVEVIGKELSLDELWKRDNLRQDSVGHSVVSSQYEQFRKEFPLFQLKDTTNKPEIIIFDIDGTVTNGPHNRTAYDWDKVDQDEPNELTIMMVNNCSLINCAPVFVSGRDEICREKTIQWLVDNTCYDETYIKNNLYMREHGDMRSDVIVKQELFFKYIDGNYKVKYVVDDRPKVVRNVWLEFGFKTFTVGNPWIEF